MTRVRFAPSPTGFLHIGGARTALFNWLYARAQKGTFILRIEDTDQVRSKQEYVDEILQSLTWLGFSWDELFFQSQRVALYRQQAERLLREGTAYLQTTEGKGEAIFFRVVPRPIVVKDLIRGEISFDSSVIKDQVLIKSDGTPTYNFACVVDDALMGITHVIRGDDHISNTPKQVLLYEALGFDLPAFAHLPLIMGIEGGRLSKRTGATAISEYRQMGYLAAALVNYLLLLSWSPKDDREIISPEEAVRLFDIRAVNKTAATFDMKKLDWMNNQYIRAADPQQLAEMLLPLLEGAGLLSPDKFDRNYLVSLVQLFKERLTRLTDFPGRADFFFRDDYAIEEQARQKYLERDWSAALSLLRERLNGLARWDAVSIEEAFRGLVGELKIEARELVHPLRVVLTGKTVGPGLFETIACLGRARTEERLERWIQRSGV